MKGIIFGFVFAVMQMVPGTLAQVPRPSSAQEGQKLPVRLIFSPDKIQVLSDSDPALTITWINDSDQTVWCDSTLSTSGVDKQYTYAIRTVDGKTVPRVRDIGDPYPESPCALGSGASMKLPVGHLMRVFDMKRPRVYTVQLSLPDNDHPGRIRGKSNILTVTVKAPE
jgi:hypothetical protein